MAVNKNTARMAGLLYLVAVLTGMFSLLYVPSHITVAGNAPATVDNIVAHNSLFRLGIAMELIGHVVFLLLPFVLYKLLSPVNREAAALMVAFAAMSVPLSFVNNVNKLDILSLLSGADYLRAFTVEQLHARVMLSLDAYNNGILVSSIFWGLWLLPFGYLVFKSGFLPKVLGILLMIGCFGYLINFLGVELLPGYEGTAIARVVRMPAALGELGTCLWLLIIGAREPASSVG